jgi:hypothetical protein
MLLTNSLELLWEFFAVYTNKYSEMSLYGIMAQKIPVDVVSAWFLNAISILSSFTADLCNDLYLIKKTIPPFLKFYRKCCVLMRIVKYMTCLNDNHYKMNNILLV